MPDQKRLSRIVALIGFAIFVMAFVDYARFFWGFGRGGEGDIYPLKHGPDVAMVGVVWLAMAVAYHFTPNRGWLALVPGALAITGAILAHSMSTWKVEQSQYPDRDLREYISMAYRTAHILLILGSIGYPNLEKILMHQARRKKEIEKARREDS